MNSKDITAELTISSLSKDGFGVASFNREDGKTFKAEIPFALPGDTIKAILFGKKRGLYKGKIAEIITPSPDRISAKCIHFGSCGGCRWQNIPYALQLRQKEDHIKTLFTPFLNQNTKFYPILACDPPWHYRNKMEFSFSQDKNAQKYLGMVLLGSKGKVFNLTECHLVNPWFVDTLKATKEWWENSTLDAYHQGKNTGSLRTLLVREGKRTGDRMAMITVSGNPDFALNKSQLEGFKQAVLSTMETPTNRASIFLRIQQIAKGMATQFYEMLLHGPDHLVEILHIDDGRIKHELKFRVSPSAFFQPNTFQAEKLYSKALQLADIPENSTVFDLYCGTATLGICVGKTAKRVIGIELSPESVVDARENIKLNQLENIEIIQGDVGTMLASLDIKPDVVLVDPPRAGLDKKAISHILKLNPPKLVYISCNPSTQAANLVDLINGGYYLEAVQPVDQFPQTMHVENIALLKRI